MGSTAAFYEVWDDSTGNRLGEFETLAEAEALLRDVLQTSGAASARTLAVLAYTPTGTNDYDVTTVIEGAEFIANLADKATLSPASGSAGS